MKLNLIFYGQPGAGKTWLAASFATKIKPCLYIDCEGQTFSLRRWDREAFDPVFVRPRTLADLKRLLGLLQDRSKFIASELGQAMNGNYPSLIIVDTMSEIQRIMSDSIKGVEGKVLEDVQLSQRNYGTLNAQTLSFIRTLNSFGTHTIYTYWAHQRITETTTSAMTVQLLGSSRDMALAYANYVGYLTTVQELDVGVRRQLRLRPTQGDDIERVIIHTNTTTSKGKDQLFADNKKYIINPTQQHFLDVLD